ncbi:thymine dioxygenase [Lentinus tigrinus ALCF2SS1-7]|uniref:Thymine dioxygenase n=1 Tax=Lentinus tigrinus ALCF2SS1-6 TaxID=1328759 RepID=A0A5C2SLS8_9APHY|nr:thymine dioxygenase [Lentinus tigrinus ALCF2SS1-6]RPD77798.1 thymine dioxygenase [Lentinus tigrinus ALCF2SS1-7]
MSSVLLGDAHGISVVDFKPFLDGSAKQDVASAILDSFKRVGFVYLINHGIPEDKIKGMFEWSKRFFDQPMEVKQLAPHPPSGTHHRGYSAPGREKVVQHLYDDKDIKDSRAKAPDVKESFECGWEENVGSPNIWLPDGVLPGFKEACMDFYSTCHETELEILRAITVGLGISEDYLVKYHDGHENQMRLLHYPSVPAEQLKDDKIVRIGAHSDFGSITLLLQDDIGGLEIEDPNTPGEFNSAPPVEGALIVNAADLMMRWSNDVIRSTVHRVRAPLNAKTVNGMVPERYSIPYFCSPERTAVVECLPGTYTADKPPKYEPISALEYIMRRLASNY